MAKIRLRAKLKGGITTVKALIKHPMERPSIDKDGNPTPGHFITEVKCEHNDKVVMSALWSSGVSQNPFLAFKFKGGAKGDKVKLTWTDNKGETGSKKVKIK
ncbi:MAG: thiosulfate oxidation carrier complex protein SoxZ [Candidatus Parabeggiatoa sp. nov. 2]|nr:MAG: thiosulfate oxidation carrier complex protein SoxZ [Beggiatoa sp. 4572_84]RKZ61706.1 MAG: thiosulfate oxidation carrier complex protein SoxZ [Gammaproteobacteria bacterium]